MLNLLLLAGLAQVPEAPETALVYAGTPQLVSNSGARIDMAWHTVSMTLDKDNAKVNCVTLFKNMSDQVVDAEVRIPIHVRGWSTHYGKNLRVLWADAPATWAGIRDDEVDTRSMRRFTRWYTYKVNFRPKAQRSLKTEITLPVQVTGPDAMERQVAYEFGATSNPLETMSFAIKYPQSLVYRTIESAPRSWGWQVGPTGAFMKRENVRLGEPTLASFRFYRGGFDKIGDGE